MNNSRVKDPYSILGVAKGASKAEIRKAFKTRARLLHPDHIDRDKRPEDWKTANEMMAELNEAYANLSGESAQTSAEEPRKTEPKPAPKPKPEPKPEPKPTPKKTVIHFENGELTPGKLRYKDLPDSVRERLLSRQANKDLKDQVQIKTSSILSLIIVFGFVLLASVLLTYQFTKLMVLDNSGTLIERLYFCGFFSAVAAAVIGGMIIDIIEYFKSTLKPYFYLTELYLIRTKYDKIQLWPIWSVEDVTVTHNYSMFIYQSSCVALMFANHTESIAFTSRRKAEAFVNQLRSFEVKLETEFSTSNTAYFVEHDDFRGVGRTSIPLPTASDKQMKMVVYGATFFVCMAVWIAMYIYIKGHGFE